MQTSQLTFKHRATEPVPAVARVDQNAKAGAHRASRTAERVIALVLVLALLALVAYLIAR